MINMSVSEAYSKRVALNDIEDDPAQRALLALLDNLAEALNKKTFFSSFFIKRPRLRGLYLFGTVGVGKTFLLDLLYNAVTTPNKKRLHLHHFMQEIDAQLRQLQGQKNPLKRIAKELSRTTRLLCFDEFIVQDLANAMIMAELLPILLDSGVVLVATSNTLPDELYLQGPQRPRFLPAIAAIKSHCRVESLICKKDYRLGRTRHVHAYISPLGEKADAELLAEFEILALNSASEGNSLTIQNREISCNRYSDKVVWFDFKVICNIPRSQLDYLEIAKRFDTVIISDVPKLDEKDTIAAILLVHFIDVLYDEGTRLIISADVPIDELYVKGEVLDDFKRTKSRLAEMQSEDYLKRHF